MENDDTIRHPNEAARTPGSAEGERDPAEQNDRADEMLNQAGDSGMGSGDEMQPEEELDDEFQH